VTSSHPIAFIRVVHHYVVLLHEMVDGNLIKNFCGMRFIPFALLLSLSSVSAYAQRDTGTLEERVTRIARKMEKQITRDVALDLDRLIPEGDIRVDVRDKVKMSPRHTELMMKFMAGIRENAEWFMPRYKRSMETGEIMEFDEKLGMTRAEWDELKGFMDNNTDAEMVSSGYEDVTVTKRKGIISFKTGDEDRLAGLNDLSIDTKRNIVKMYGYTLTPIDTICVSHGNHAFRSAWRGYRWEYAEPLNGVMPTTLEELANYSALHLSIVVGLIEDTGETVIKVSASEIVNGQKTVDYKIPLFFE
jgi:hypothetical protein